MNTEVISTELNDRITVLMAAVTHHDNILKETLRIARHVCSNGEELCSIVEKLSKNVTSARMMAFSSVIFSGISLANSISNNKIINNKIKDLCDRVDKMEDLISEKEYGVVDQDEDGDF